MLCLAVTLLRVDVSSTLLDDLNEAAKLVTPSGTAYYNQVVVLAFEWRTGDPKIAVKILHDKLLETIKTTYNLEVQHVHITSWSTLPPRLTLLRSGNKRC